MRTLDLRRTLVLRLALALGALLLGFGLVGLKDLRDDALAEQAAAARLVDLLLATRSDSPEVVARLLAEGPLRHVRASLLEGASEPQTRPAQPAWLGIASDAQPRLIPVGSQLLQISPDPHSEWREKRTAALQLVGLLALFAAIALVSTWWATDRALQPAREIESALERLQSDETQPLRLPRFALREFQAIAHKIEHLAAALAQAASQQRRLTDALMQVQDQERRHLARELHDEFGQSLTAIAASAAYVERHAGQAPARTLAECARDIGQETRRISDQVRQMLSELSAYGLPAQGLDSALREMVRAWQARLPGLRLSSRIEDLPALPETCSLALYRSLQEALTNCVRHSQASQIQVDCACQGNALELVVADNGCGRADQVRERTGNGLMGLRERLRQAGGWLGLHDRPEGGLVLTVRLPLPGAAAVAAAGAA